MKIIDLTADYSVHARLSGYGAAAFDGSQYL